MYEFHALYKTVFLHNVMEKNAAIIIELPKDNVITVQNVWYAWRATIGGPLLTWLCC